MSRSPHIAVVVLVVFGCNRTPEPAPKGTDARSDRAPAVASLTVASDEILWGLGDAVRSRVVAVSSMADDARYSPVAEVWPDAVPRVAATAEAVLAVGPDLAVVASFTAVETRTMLEQAGVELVVVDAFDGFDDYRETVTRIGTALDAGAEAQRMIGEFDARLAALQSSASASRPAVLSWNEGSVAGRATTFDDAAQAAGFVNLAAAQGIDGHGRVGLETVLAWDPPWLVIPCGELACPEAERAFAARPGVAAMQAVRSGQLVGIESPILYSTGATMLDLVEALQRRKEQTP